MDKEIEVFIKKGSFDPHDRIAKRAIHTMSGLLGLRQNAYDRGDSAGFIECSLGLKCAVRAFGCVNTAKHYPFAAKVHPCIESLTKVLQGLHDPVEKAAGLLDQAEATLLSLKDELTPVCTVRGISSVAILRGDFCTAAMADVIVANDNG
jgi:hypothetical protein